MSEACIKGMNKGTWEYIKTIAKKERVKIAVVIEHMAELHAKETGQESLLKTLQEIYQDKVYFKH